MAILLTSPISLLKIPTTVRLRYLCPKYSSVSFSPSPKNPYPTPPRLLISTTTTRRFATPYPSELPDPTSDKDDEEPDKPPTTFTDEWGDKSSTPEPDPPTKFPDSDPPKDDDEWGDKSSAPEPDPPTKFPDSDPPKDDEWGQPEAKGLNGISNNNGVAGVNEMDDSIGDDDNDDDRDDRVEELKRCLVDSVYGTDLGFKASSEVRAEIFELVSQLEALNPISAPTDAVDLLDGNWVLLYTAFSELLPLLAVGTIPLLKVEKICQSINTTNLTIDNSITLSSPLATITFSASATFEVRSPSRIQVQFREGTFQPPEIKSRVDLPENVNLFGQKISLSPVQQSLNPLQEAFAGVARAVSGQAPLKVPIPGERSESWLLITYLDKDFRISRGDGGLFVLVKQGSPLLDQ